MAPVAYDYTWLIALAALAVVGGISALPMPATTIIRSARTSLR